MNRKLSKTIDLGRLPDVELSPVIHDDQTLAETVYGRKFSLQALEKGWEQNRKSIDTVSDAYGNNSEKNVENHSEKGKDLHVPVDKCKTVKIMTFVLGLIYTLPQTFFTTANEYWMYKFRDPTSSSTDANDRTYLQANFTSLNHLISMGPSTVASVVITIYAHKIKPKTRTMSTFIAQLLIFLLQTAFVQINTDNWQVSFFCITMTIFAILSCTSAFGATGNMIIASQFPDQYMKLYLIGEGVASLVNAVMRLVSIGSSPSVTGAALIYFVTGCFLVSFSCLLFYCGSKVEYYRYYTKNMKNSVKRKIPNLKDFRSVFQYIFPILLLHIFNLALPHMAIMALVVSEYYGTDSVWGNTYFVTCTTYLLTAICEITGRVLFYKFEADPPISIVAVLFVGRELLFYPLLYFVNAKPRNHLPVLFPYDWQYALIIGMHSMCSGYMCNILMLKQMRTVPAEMLELSWMVTFLVMKLMSVVHSPLGVLAVSLL